MKGIRIALAALAIGAVCAPAAAQVTMGMEGGAFVEALRSGDDGQAAELLKSHPNIVNFRDGKGETALMIAVQKRDSTWTGYLLNQDADPNIADRDGNTPLIMAARAGFETGADWLLQSGAKVDDANRMGETALIVAVQRRHPEIVKLLLAHGANPDKTDTAAGYSARDYAKRDGRNPEISRMIEGAGKKSSTKTGPVAR